MATSSNRTAIITGSSRGIGAAIAERLAKDGFNVIINYAGNVAEAEALTAKILASGGQAVAVRGDVADPAAVKMLFDRAEAEFGGVDVLVNNAGIMPMVKFAETDDATFDKTVAINIKGVFNGMREAARRLRGGGRIISFSSSVVGLYQPTYGVYAGTKGAVEAMTHVLANELRGRNITVNAVAPGPTATDLLMRGKTQEMIDRLIKVSPLERLGQVQDIAGVVAFLAGPDGSWINGQVVRANGGAV